MKKLIFLLTAVLIVSAPLYSQWVLQSTPTTNALEAIFVVNANVIYAAGDNETIIKTTNGGSNWILLRENSAGKDYLDIHFFNENTGIAVGGIYSLSRVGLISKTTNGGLNWVDSITSGICFRGIEFVNSTTGYLGGWVNSASVSPILITTNAGGIWLSVTPFNCYGIECFSFLNESTGFATGDHPNCQGVFKTTDAGYSWTLNSDFGNGVWLCSVFFVNANTGWVTGNQASPWSGLLRKTTNGGLNWTHQMNANTNETYEMFFLNENTGWVAGDSPNIQKTTNGGANWFTQSTPSAWWMWDIQFINENTGWAAGSQGKVFYTTNGGGTVSVQNISSEIPASFSLLQNYPNPFNPRTVISFSLSVVSNAILKVYDVMGREVQTLVNERLQAGTYETTFDGSGLNSGVYFYRLKTEGFSETKRMILLK